MTNRHIWIPQHFTEPQADALMSTLEKAPDLTQQWVEAFPAPAPQEQSKRGRKSDIEKEVLSAWLLAQGFEWNVFLKQAAVKRRREMILEALNTQDLPEPLAAAYFKDADPYVLNNDRKEIRDRLAELAQELWGDPLVATGSTLDATTAWLLGEK